LSTVKVTAGVNTVMVTATKVADSQQARLIEAPMFSNMRGAS
jgi:hypothetical protein